MPFLAPILASLLAVEPAPATELVFLHSLASSAGVLPISGRLAWEPSHQELFVTGHGLVRVFNTAGMQVYEFGEDPAVGSILGAVPLENGDLIALSSLQGKLVLLRVDFRGGLQGTVVLEVPEKLAGFAPSVLRYAGGKLYLADVGQMTVLVVDPSGALLDSYDVAALLSLSDQERADTGLRGFNVDFAGNLLLTIQPLFAAYVISPDRTVRTFGVRGSTPGKFNVVGGITRDAAGNLYVADMLRSVVMVFDANFEFVHEFGYRGKAPGALAGPDEIALGDGQLFVVNNARLGVSVFKVEHR